MKGDDLEKIKNMHILALIEKVCEDEIASLEDQLPDIVNPKEKQQFLLAIDALNMLVDRANNNADSMIEELNLIKEKRDGKLH
jgi:hypothetical protein|tara:strand:+ start:1044 stop:1292 length:249 start_codon:yes stop_codon:yes gene_type:complete